MEKSFTHTTRRGAKALIVASFFLFFSGSHFSAAGETTKFCEDCMSDIETLLQTAIDHPDLQPYYHVQDLPERAPMTLVIGSVQGVEPRLNKFGQPVTVQVERSDAPSEMILETMNIGDTSASLELLYPAEGVRATFDFTKDAGVWNVTSSQVAEK